MANDNSAPLNPLCKTSSVEWKWLKKIQKIFPSDIPSTLSRSVISWSLSLSTLVTENEIESMQGKQQIYTDLPFQTLSKQLSWLCYRCFLALRSVMTRLKVVQITGFYCLMWHVRVAPTGLKEASHLLMNCIGGGCVCLI